MENKMTIIENSEEYLGAMELHQQILANGTIAATAFAELCRNLKAMRDRGAFRVLGYETFEDYCITAANIKARQAYNYISTYERLGPELLQSNAQLGITKLALLAQVTEEQREELLTSGAADDLSTREMQKLVDELTKAKEQLSFLENENNLADVCIDKMQNDTTAAAEKIEALQKKLDELDGAEKRAADETEKIRKKAEKDIADARAAADQATQSADNKIADALAEGIKQGKETAEKTIQAAGRESAALLAKSQELEKKLQVQGSSETVRFSLLFEEFQNQFNKLVACSATISAADPEAGEKYRGALKKYLGLMDQKI